MGVGMSEFYYLICVSEAVMTDQFAVFVIGEYLLQRRIPFHSES